MQRCLPARRHTRAAAHPELSAAHPRKGRPVVTTLMIAITLLLTIAAALGLGVIFGYAMISAILHAMGRRPQPVPEHVLATTEGHSGD
jgi:hypothetical protein